MPGELFFCLVWVALATTGNCHDGPSGSPCAPVFHSRYGMWIDPCHSIVHVSRNRHTTLNCNGPLRISIVGATYGPLCLQADSSNKCLDSCQSTSVVETVRLVCGANNVFSCRVQARDTLYENPCPSTVPVLAISFTCLYPVYTFIPRGTLISLRDWGGYSSTCECGGELGGYDGRKKRAIFGAEQLAVWANTRSVIQFFSSIYEVLQFSGVFNEVDPCPPALQPLVATSRCATSVPRRYITMPKREIFDPQLANNAEPENVMENGKFFSRQIYSDGELCLCSFRGSVIFSNGSTIAQGDLNGLCRTPQDVSAVRPCFCGTDEVSDCFFGERCCSYAVQPFCDSGSTGTTTSVPIIDTDPPSTTSPIGNTTIPTTTTSMTNTTRPVLAVVTSQTETTCVDQTGAGSPDPAGVVTATGGTPPYAWRIESTDGNFDIDSGTGALTVKKDLAAGTYSITVLVQDANGYTAQRQVTVQVCAVTYVRTF